MPKSSTRLDAEVLSQLIAALQKLQPDARRRVLHTASTFFNVSGGQGANRSHGLMETVSVVEAAERRSHVPFSDDRVMSPKAFMLEKQPRTTVERIACLAYYLTHYRETAHFKTVELTKLNTEAALSKMSNPASATADAVKRGYLVPATKGMKQLSAAGEQFVLALPDRNAARDAMASTRPRRRSGSRKVAARKQKA